MQTVDGPAKSLTFEIGFRFPRRSVGGKTAASMNTTRIPEASRVGRRRDAAYRRDMGGGNVVLMKSAAAPITIRGRHWGGLSMGYAVSDSGNR